MKPVKKTLYTLNLPQPDGKPYCPELTDITIPLMKKYAEKIGAEFYIIDKDKFPGMPVTMNKFQMYDLCKEREDDWSIYFDVDTVVHPDFFDPTAHVTKDTTVSGMVSDFTPVRFKPDEYFLRDGRYQGKGTFFLAWSDLCLDFVNPNQDISFEEMVSRISPTVNELKNGVTPQHLLDDYMVSRNIARYSLKHVLVSQIQQKYGIQGASFIHFYVKTDDWFNPVADPKAGFTADDLNRYAQEYGKPTSEFTLSEFKVCAAKKNLGLWGLL